MIIDLWIYNYIMENNKNKKPQPMEYYKQMKKIVKNYKRNPELIINNEDKKSLVKCYKYFTKYISKYMGTSQQKTFSDTHLDSINDWMTFYEKRYPNEQEVILNTYLDRQG